MPIWYEPCPILYLVPLSCITLSLHFPIFCLVLLFLLLQGNLFNLLSLLQEAVFGTMIDVFSDKKQTRKFVLFINGRSWVAIKERTSSIDKFSQQRAPLLLLLLLLLFFSSASNSPSLSLSALKQLLSTD